MIRKKIDSKVEQQLLIALIISKPFLSQAAPVLDLDLIHAEHFKQIAKWCLDYFQEYRKAPGKHIETIYYAWAETQDKSSVLVEAVHDFLDHLNSEYDSAKELNVPYLLDSLSSYLAMKKMQRASETLEYALSQGNRKEAEQVFADYSSVNLGQGSGVNFLSNRQAWLRTFAAPSEPLFAFNGDVGRFFNVALTRDALIGIQGPEKRGKTWWCVEFVIQALMHRRKVALFEVGDLSESQIMLRLGVRLSGLPMYDNQKGEIAYPKKLRWTEGGDDGESGHYFPVNTIKTCDQRITRRACVRACKKFMRDVGIPPRETYTMASVHPNSTVNVADIDGILQRWEHENGFIPDVIVIDYADILAPEDTRKDPRHQVNDTWKALRRLSQERHCLVIVPTQANAASYETQIQTMRNFSEDKRKLAHVTGMIGLNQSVEEKDRQIMRLNWIVLRESPYSTNTCLHVGQCLTLGRALCCGRLGKGGGGNGGKSGEDAS